MIVVSNWKIIGSDGKEYIIEATDYQSAADYVEKHVKELLNK